MTDRDHDHVGQIVGILCRIAEVQADGEGNTADRLSHLRDLAVAELDRMIDGPRRVVVIASKGHVLGVKESLADAGAFVEGMISKAVGSRFGDIRTEDFEIQEWPVGEDVFSKEGGSP